MKVFLLNDGGREPHVGCLAVSNALRHLLKGEGAQIVARHYIGQDKATETDEASGAAAALTGQIGRRIRKVDAVLVNGEGTIHHGKGGHLLSALAAAQELGKWTGLVNAVLQNVGDFSHTLARLDVLQVREHRSASVAHSMGGRPEVVADLCVRARWLREPAVDFGGRVVVGDGHSDCREVVGALAALPAEWPRFSLQAPERKRDWRHAVASLRTASCYVTGRHHGVCLAMLAGIPVVALPSNSHKVDGLCEMLGLPVCRSVRELPIWIRAAISDAGRKTARDAAARLAEVPRRPLLEGLA